MGPFRAALFTFFPFLIMIKTHFLLAAALVLATGVASCKKDNTDPDGLPPATQEGKNTGDFLVNGMAFNPQPGPAAPGGLVVKAQWGRTGNGQTDDVHLSFYRYDNGQQKRYFDLFLSGVLAQGQFLLRTQVTPNTAPGRLAQFADYTVDANPLGRKTYLTGPTAQGSVIVTRFDTTARIIAGTFEAKIKEYQGTDSLSITKGRFDLKF